MQASKYTSLWNYPSLRCSVLSPNFKVIVGLKWQSLPCEHYTTYVDFKVISCVAACSFTIQKNWINLSHFPSKYTSLWNYPYLRCSVLSPNFKVIVGLKWQSLPCEHYTTYVDFKVISCVAACSFTIQKNWINLSHFPSKSFIAFSLG
jgi:hypothetical protein